MTRRRSARATEAAEQLIAKLGAAGPEDLDLELIATLRARRTSTGGPRPEASDFAAEVLHARAFLEPLVAVPPEVPFTIDEVHMIAERFDMSLTSTALRCVELARDAACAFAMLANGRVAWHAMSAAFRGKGRPVADGALARALAADGERVDGEVEGGAWGNRAVHGMREQSVKGGGVVLTWLWHPPG